MKKLPIQSCTIIAIDLRNYNQSILSPQLSTLIQQGWTIKASVPIADNDVPLLLLILAPPTLLEKISFKSLLMIYIPLVIFLAIFLFIFK